jgi:3-methyladenine DNA glycosylase AlkC
MPKRPTDEFTARVLMERFRQEAKRDAIAIWAKDRPETEARWAEEERVECANAMKGLQELERYYEALPSLPSTDLRRHEMLYEIRKAKQSIGDDLKRTKPPFERKWVVQRDEIRLSHERISLEWANHTVRGFGTFAASRKAHPDTDEKYRACVKRIREMRKANALSLTSAIKALARPGSSPRIPESTSWRAWRRFGALAK